MRGETEVAGARIMIRLILLTMILASTSAQAGFKMFVPGQKEPVMYGNETAEEKATREAKEAEYRQVRDELREQTERNARAVRKRPEPIYTQEELLQGQPYDGPTNVRGPAPGGHRRHIWRERTGFNTPAQKIRYENEIRRLKRELKKERAKPSPYGAHPLEIRKQIKTKF